MFFNDIKNMSVLQYVFSGLFRKMLPNKACLQPDKTGEGGERPWKRHKSCQALQKKKGARKVKNG